MLYVITTQYMENYGFSEGLQHWKCKGGGEYKVKNVLPTDVYSDIVDKLGIEYKNDASEEYVIGVAERPDDYLSESEKLQLEFEGRIIYPEKVFDYNEYRNK